MPAPAGLWREERGPEGAPLVVLVHGSMDRAGSFLQATRRLPAVRFLRYDRRGYGRSTGAGPPADTDGHVADLVALLGERPAVLVGHSYGGTVALAAAARRPELARSVGAFEAPTPWKPWYPTSSGSARTAATPPGEEEAAAEEFMRRLVGEERWRALPPRTRRARRAEGPALVAEMRASRSGARPYDPAALTMPVLTGHGTRSPAHLRRAAAELAQDVPRGELMVLEGADHGAHFGDPAAFARFVERAVARAGEA